MFPTTRSKLIKNLENFIENKILNYHETRSFDTGTPHQEVSRLSPYISRRFISEYKILNKILIQHKIEKVQKFIEEIYWRTYWRGWLETHPWIYNEYIQNCNNEFVPPKTGIKCFDHWKQELIETGYLHNHSRMWFASIWIFTLGYSWQSGANFFKKNLIDWCPASNTLGWRWVAGLQTNGKSYVAKAENIKFYTKNRFYPKLQLKENLIISNNDLTNGTALDLDYKEKISITCEDNLGIVLNNNDLTLDEVIDDLGYSYKTCLFIKQNHNQLINRFENKLYEDIISYKDRIQIVNNFEEIFKWIEDKKIKNLILPYETIGNEIFNNKAFLNKINKKELNYVFYLRKWDAEAFPYAKKGFFNFKKNIPSLIKANGL